MGGWGLGDWSRLQIEDLDQPLSRMPNPNPNPNPSPSSQTPQQAPYSPVVLVTVPTGRRQDPVWGHEGAGVRFKVRIRTKLGLGLGLAA